MARTLFRDPDLLLMDEATSALDKYSEGKLVEYLKTYLVGKTAFVISHNLHEYQSMFNEKINLKELSNKKHK